MKKFSILLVMILALALTACGSSGGGGGSAAGAEPTDNAGGDALVFTIAHVSGEESVNHQMALKMQELFTEKSGGAIRLDIYSAGSLGTERDYIQGVKAGDLTFGIGSTPNTVAVIPELSIFDTPFLFRSVDEIRAAYRNEAFRGMLDDLYESYGYQLSVFSDQGFRQLSTNDRRVESVADLQGLNIRVMENEFHIAFWGALGTNPTPMAQAEVYLSLQQGLLDAQENPYNNIYGYKFHEIQKFVIDTNHIFLPQTVIANVDYYNSLSDDVKAIWDEVMVETEHFVREYVDETARDFLQLLEAAGMEHIVLDEAVQDEMAALTLPIRDDIRENCGAPELFDMYMQVAGVA